MKSSRESITLPKMPVYTHRVDVVRNGRDVDGETAAWTYIHTERFRSHTEAKRYFDRVTSMPETRTAVLAPIPTA